MLPAAGCPYCADPSVLLEVEGVELGDQVRAGMAVHEMVSTSDGRLVLDGPLNVQGDRGGLW
ncbi:MAG TPA: hypothetical protein VGX25_06830 [Actinophytocola sp.]|uniref:hypothetical protein n=1 Tax=Actinophytocola sp. TaxID=1872138 RepID=UPI002DDC90EC|nr:hypothetical protein [Actinophytocola sp.]HEV2779103.1 hypothetical protein [Actinophytocola sp.]